MRTFAASLSLFSLAFLGLARGAEPVSAPATSVAAPQLVSVHKVWDASAHQAFTDLIRYKGKWVLAFREGEKHVGAKGARNNIRVLTSSDAETWTSVAELTDPRGDIRDAKMAILPDGRLTLLTCTALINDGPRRGTGYQSIAFFTDDLKSWSKPIDVGPANVWLWGIKAHDGAAYSIGYGTGGADGRFVRLFKTVDGEKYEPVTEKFDIPHPFPNENAIHFDGNGTATCLLRCDPTAANKSDPSYAFIGTASAPYTHWTWKRTDARIGGPALTRTPDGRLLGAGRLWTPKTRTSLFWVDPGTAAVTECLTLPSGGDTSYPGLVWDGPDTLRISYYSSHEDKKAKIFFATVRIPAAPPRKP